MDQRAGRGKRGGGTDDDIDGDGGPVATALTEAASAAPLAEAMVAQTDSNGVAAASRLVKIGCTVGRLAGGRCRRRHGGERRS